MKKDKQHGIVESPKTAQWESKINLEKLEKAISKIKIGKGSRIDNLKPEMIKWSLKRKKKIPT